MKRSAVAGSDYLAVSGTLVLAPGQTSQTIVVNAYGDTSYETDETFTVVLANATVATIAMSSERTNAAWLRARTGASSPAW